ncbi:WDR64 protein, partial [Panurus biarmicus]|nr:WDR64 protein [Panurus biarmicus]
PILASAHESSCIRLWSIQGNLMKELRPFSEHPSGPLTVLCTDSFTKILLTGSKGETSLKRNTGCIFCSAPERAGFNVTLLWKSDLSQAIIFFQPLLYFEHIGNGNRLWHARTGYYFGYFGQSRKFELSDTSRLILPSDVKDFSAIIKEESKHKEKKKVIYPLILDRDK